MSSFELSAVLLIVLLVVVAIVFRVTSKRKSQPWRIARSRTWIKSFREKSGQFNEIQRFSYIRKIDHFLWEEVIMTCFEERGYQIKRTKMTRDGGADGFVTINGERVVIQAKRYSGPISKSHVLDLANLVSASPGVRRGLFIHTGKTSQPIREIVRNSKSIEMISGIREILNFIDGKEMILFGLKIRSIN